jgi:anti-sigma B factor antagonist
MTSTRIEVDRSAGDRPCIVRADGEFDLSNASELGSVLEKELGQGDVVLELSGITFMDSSVIAAIVKSRNLAIELNRTLRIREPSSVALRLLGLVGLEFLIEGEEA